MIDFRAFRRLVLASALVMLGMAVASQARAVDISTVGAEDGEPWAQWGGGFEFRRRIAAVDNPYCDITTYVLADYPQQAISTIDEKGRPAIVIDLETMKTDPAYAHFLMAHECCHHTLGHVRLTSARLGQLGPQPFYYIQPLLRTMELDADSCAARMLNFTREPGAIEAARQRMLAFGAKPTGAHYPTGVERAAIIDKSAGEATWAK